MLESHVSQSCSTPKEEEAGTKEDIAYTPIGMPIIAGSLYTLVMILYVEAGEWEF